MVIAIAYAAIAVTVNELILTWYVYSGVNLTAARQNTVAIVAQYDSGTRYWIAYLADYYGLGGIRIADPIPHTFAQEIVLRNNMFDNVFAMNYSDAVFLATYAYGNGFFGPEAHRDGGKILNMQHVHARLIHGGRGNCHVFFAIPSIA